MPAFQEMTMQQHPSKGRRHQERNGWVQKRVENTDGNSCDDASEDDSNNEGDNDATTVAL